MGRFLKSAATLSVMGGLLAGCAEIDLKIGDETPTAPTDQLPSNFNIERAYYSYKISVGGNIKCQDTHGKPFVNSLEYVGLALGEPSNADPGEDAINRLPIAVLLKSENEKCVFSGVEKHITPFRRLAGLEYRGSWGEIRSSNTTVQLEELQSAVLDVLKLVPNPGTTSGTAVVVGIIENETTKKALKSLYGTLNSQLGKLWNSSAVSGNVTNNYLIDARDTHAPKLNRITFPLKLLDKNGNVTAQGVASIEPKLIYSAWILPVSLANHGYVVRKVPITATEMRNVARSIDENGTTTTWGEYINSKDPDGELQVASFRGVGQDIDLLTGEDLKAYIHSESKRLNDKCTQLSGHLARENLTRFDQAHFIAEHVVESPLWQKISSSGIVAHEVFVQNMSVPDDLRALITKLSPNTQLTGTCLSGFKNEFNDLGMQWVNGPDARALVQAAAQRIEHIEAEVAKNFAIEFNRVKELFSKLTNKTMISAAAYYSNFYAAAFPEGIEKPETISFRDGSDIVAGSTYTIAGQYPPADALNAMHGLGLERFGCIVPSVVSGKIKAGSFDAVMMSRTKIEGGAPDQFKDIPVKVRAAWTGRKDESNVLQPVVSKLTVEPVDVAFKDWILEKIVDTNHKCYTSGTPALFDAVQDRTG